MLFLAYANVGIPLAVIPLYVAKVLELGVVASGALMGLQFIATLICSGYAGFAADRIGSRRTLNRGLFLCIAAGAAYACATLSNGSAWFSFVSLSLGRVLLGFGEAHVVLSVMTWCVSLARLGGTGAAINSIGIAAFAALSIGPPVGIWLFDSLGFIGVACATIAAPVAAFALSRGVHQCEVARRSRVPIQKVLAQVFLPGLGLVGQTIGVSMIAMFISLRFEGEGWGGAGLALAAFGFSNIAIRIAWRKFPDRYGGARVALWSLAVEAIGLFALASSTSQESAIAAVVVSGAGCALVFPALALEIVTRVPSTQRGTALGSYSMMMDLTNGLTGPAAGFLATQFGYGAMYAAGGAAAIVGMCSSAYIWRRAVLQSAF